MPAVVTPAPEEAERVRRVYDRAASNYGRNVRIPERLLFPGARMGLFADAKRTASL